MAVPERAQWTIPAELVRVGPLVLDLAGHLERRGIVGLSLFKAQLLLEEIVSNVVRHSLHGDPHRDVRILLTVDEEDLTLVVEDDGRPFDPLRDAPCPDLDSPLELRREGGLGLHLVRHMADETVYERVGQANRVRMRVDLRPTA